MPRRVVHSGGKTWDGGRRAGGSSGGWGAGDGGSRSASDGGRRRIGGGWWSAGDGGGGGGSHRSTRVEQHRYAAIVVGCGEVLPAVAVEIPHRHRHATILAAQRKVGRGPESAVAIAHKHRHI